MYGKAAAAAVAAAACLLIGQGGVGKVDDTQVDLRTHVKRINKTSTHKAAS